MNPKNDPVAEIHDVRAQLLEEAGSLNGLMETLMRRQAEKPSQVVARPPMPAHISTAA